MNRSALLLTLVVTTLSLQHSAIVFAGHLPDTMIQFSKSIDLITSTRKIHAISINGKTWDVDPFINWESMAQILNPLFAELFPIDRHAKLLNDLREWMGSSWIEYKEGVAIARHLHDLVGDLAILVQQGAKSSMRVETYYSTMRPGGESPPGACVAAEKICDRGGHRDTHILQCTQCVVGCGKESAKSTTEEDFMKNGYDMVRCARRAVNGI